MVDTLAQHVDDATPLDFAGKPREELEAIDILGITGIGNGSTCSIFLASIRRSSPDGCLDVFPS
jgi:hypothetical protein